jgi:hypothetical protein
LLLSKSVAFVNDAGVHIFARMVTGGTCGSCMSAISGWHAMRDAGIFKFGELAQSDVEARWNNEASDMPVAFHLT